MAPRLLTINEISQRLRPAMRERAVRKAVLFGSYARGEATHRSDINLLIVMDTAQRFVERCDGLIRELTDAVAGPAVEPIVFTPAELDLLRDRPFIRKALSEGVTIYE